MDKIILKRRFHLGKVDATGTGRKANEVTIDLTLTEHGGDPGFHVNDDAEKMTGVSSFQQILHIIHESCRLLLRIPRIDSLINRDNEL